MLRLLTLGGLSLERDGISLDHVSTSRKGLVLLAVLAAHGALGRDRLMALLWPESDTERARGSLKQTVHTLRRQLQEPDLLLGTAELRLNPERIETDVQAFVHALEAGHGEEAISLYRGPFLDGVHLTGTPDFEHWLDGWRDELAARFRGSLEAQALAARGRTDVAAEVGWRRRLQAADPFSSRAALKLMEALVRAGDPASALQHARTHELLLGEALGVSPDPSVQDLVDRLRAGESEATSPYVSGGKADPSLDRHAEPLAGGPSRAAEVGSGVGPKATSRHDVDPDRSSDGSPRRPNALSRTFAGEHPFVLAGGLLLLLGAGAIGLLLERDRTGEGMDPIAVTDEVASSPTPLSSVAVLPFVDMSPDGDLEYLADGIAEEILNTLAGIRELRVPARTSSFHFKGRNLPIREIAEQLGVSHVLEGSLRKAGERIRVTVQFVDARADQHLWSRTFDPQLDDVFVLQDEIARAVAGEVRVHLAPGPVARNHPPTGNPAAHDLYLRGLFHWNRRSGPDLLLAIRFFEEATELDPGYARAWAGLALVYAVIPLGFAPALSADVARNRLEIAADRALALDSTLAEVHAARGLSYHFEWRWHDAEREYRRAIDLNPRYATAHQWYGEHLAKVGQPEAGVASVRRALELDPLSLVVRNDLGLVLLLAGHRDAAREAWEETLRMDPGFSIPHYFLHRLALIEGNLVASEEMGRRWAALTGAAPVEEIVLLTRAVGAPEPRPEALAVLDRWEARGDPRWLDIAFYRTHLDDVDGAIRGLEEGMKARVPMMVQLSSSPWFDPLRGDPRLEALIRELGLPG